MAPAKQNSNFPIKVTPFDGDPSMLEHFFNQVESLAKINCWSELQTVFFVKANLTGNALRFLVDSPDCQACTSVSTLRLFFKKFFVSSSLSVSIFDFNALKLQPQESIRSFAHRIDSMARKVYPNISEDACAQIKFSKFISSIPGDIRLNLLTENITNYPVAVEKAQTLQDILKHNQVLTVAMSHQEDPSDDIGTLKELVNSLRSEVMALKESHQSDSIHHQPSAVNRDRSPQKPHRHLQPFKKS